MIFTLPLLSPEHPSMPSSPFLLFELPSFAVTCRIFKNKTEYDAEVPAYFLIVENETDTYIANDYVCRHKLPRFDGWLNTLTCFQKRFYFKCCEIPVSR